MRTLWVVLGIVSLCLIGPSFTLSEEATSRDSSGKESNLSVQEMIFCAGIKRRAPVGVSDTFPADIYSVCCFTKIRGAKDTIAIFHNWYHGDTKIAGVELRVKSSMWRTWSSKKMIPGWRGEWKVETTTSDGTIIGAKTFRLE